MEKILFTFGTRPEAIKMAPVIREFQQSGGFQVYTCLTAQHREMLDQVVQLFNLKVDYDLNLMRENQSLHDVAPSIISRMREVLEECRPDLCFVQGDTTTTFATALACFYAKVKVAHIEAGLRSQHRDDPFPEEINRRLTSQLTELHFAPTLRSALHLIKEGLPEHAVHITGNTVVDALYLIQDYPVKFQDPLLDQWVRDFDRHQEMCEGRGRRFVLVTAHRRENFGAPMEEIMKSIRALALGNQDLEIIYPVHPNPNVHKLAHSMLGDVANIRLTTPLEYHEFVSLLKRCYFVLTDSGGVQEEAPYLQRPVLLMRKTTERPEAVECGSIRMVGTSMERILSEANRLLHDREHYLSMARLRQPFGDGKASKKIVEIVKNYQLGMQERERRYVV